MAWASSLWGRVPLHLLVLSDTCFESLPGRFLQAVRPARDLESNWAVDLAQNLDEYLLSICSGHISIQDAKIFTVNFAEAALLLQGTVQVYGRKVEYLYSLVLHALDFISQKSREEQVTSETADPSAAEFSRDEVDASFFDLDDIVVDPKHMLDCSISGNATHRYLFKPPANLAMLEGECMDIGADSEELESYLLATSDIYRDFILLDPLDAVAVDNILECSGRGNTNINWRSSMFFKGQKSFKSPSRQTLDTAVKLSVKKKQVAWSTQSHCDDVGHESSDADMQGYVLDDLSHGNINGEYGTIHQYSECMNNYSDEDDDPWKPLNPHKPGTLKVKPYEKVKTKGRRDQCSRKHHPLDADFPLAKIHGSITADLTDAWEAKQVVSKVMRTSQPLSLYEKLRQSLVLGRSKIKDASYSPKNNEDDEYHEGDQEMGPHEVTFYSGTCSDEDEPPLLETNKDPEPDISLEDLCRSHLDALLATLAENMMQSELSARVSTWKQRIEETLEEQDARSPFDIHKYGQTVVDKLYEEGDVEKALSFGDVVKGQMKYDVARTFSAILQLVNSGDVDVVRSSSVASSCHSNEKPFYVRLVGSSANEERVGMMPKKRSKSSSVETGERENRRSGRGESTSEGKKRRKSNNIA